MRLTYGSIYRAHSYGLQVGYVPPLISARKAHTCPPVTKVVCVVIAGNSALDCLLGLFARAALIRLLIFFVFNRVESVAIIVVALVHSTGEGS